VLRVGLDDVPEQPPVRESRQSLLRIVAPGIAGVRDGADPVLGERAVAFDVAAEFSDQRAAAVRSDRRA